MIEVRLFATFREGRQKILSLPVEGFPTCLAVVNHLEIDPQEVAICLVNGRHQGLDCLLQDGDVLALFPPVGGG